MSPDEAAHPSAAPGPPPDGGATDAQPQPPLGVPPRKAGQCAVCQACDAKYTCPRCSVRTCSASCVASHKVSSGCSGKRDVTAFAPIAAMGDATLRSDLALLEDTERAAVAAKRARGTGAPWAGAASKVLPAAAKLQRVRPWATQQQRGALPYAPACYLLPGRCLVSPSRVELTPQLWCCDAGGKSTRHGGAAAAARHVETERQPEQGGPCHPGAWRVAVPCWASHFTDTHAHRLHACQSITWHVEWVFPTATPEVRLTCPVHEDVTLRRVPGHKAPCARQQWCLHSARRPHNRDAIAKLLQPRDMAQKGGHQPQVDAPTRHALRMLIPLFAPPPPPPPPPAPPPPPPPAPAVFLLQKVGVPACRGALWVEVAGDVPLRVALASAWILEFPTLHVLPREEVAARGYTLAASAGPEAAMPDNKWL